MSLTLVTLDFESYYDKDCNIKKLGVSQYVQHERFEVNSLAFKTPNMDSAVALSKHKVVRFMEGLKQNQHRIALAGHNLYFDGYLAAYHYGFVPRFYLCTLQMANALDSQYGPISLDALAKRYGLGKKVEGVLDEWKGLTWEEATPAQRMALLDYNRQDTELTEKLLYKMMPHMPSQELRIADLTMRMFTEPRFRVNERKAKQIVKEEQAKSAEALELAGVEDRKQLSSNPQFADLLRERGFDVPMKHSPTTGKEIPALAQADLPFQKMLESDDPELARLMQARTTVKSRINETRAKAFLARAHAPVPIYLGYAAAHTLRWGGGDNINPQNLPREGMLRECLEAPPGHVLVIVDAAQIEARDNAVFSEQWDLVEAFAQGIDVYSEFATELYGFTVTKADNWKERFVGKTAILGLGYQMGAPKFQLTLEVGMMGPPVVISLEEANVAVQKYRRKYYMIVRNWRTLQGMINCMMDYGKETEYRGVVFEPGGTILMPNGLRLHYPGLSYTVNEQYQSAEFYYKPWNWRYKQHLPVNLYGGKLLENIIQCRARCMTAEHMLKLAKHYKVVLMAHDEIVMCVPNHKAETCLKDALEIMATPPRWNEKCPLKGEGEISKHYVKPE